MTSFLEAIHPAPFEVEHATCSAPRLLDVGAVSALSLESNV